MKLWKEFTFEAGHHLPNLPPEHKCSRRHGHTYRFRLHIEGKVDPALGWIVDYGGLLKAAGDLVCGALDHRYLNDIEGLENPTAELLATWIWKTVASTGLSEGSNRGRFRLVGVEIFETATAGVYYDGTD